MSEIFVIKVMVELNYESKKKQLNSMLKCTNIKKSIKKLEFLVSIEAIAINHFMVVDRNPLNLLRCTCAKDGHDKKSTSLHFNLFTFPASVLKACHSPTLNHIML